MQKYISLIWVSSHTGIRGNDNADLLAQRAKELNYIETIPLDPVELFPLWMKYITRLWEIEWIGLSTK